MKSVLNLVISGIPSILGGKNVYCNCWIVLNLVISGIPSILFDNVNMVESEKF